MSQEERWAFVSKGVGEGTWGDDDIVWLLDHATRLRADNEQLKAMLTDLEANIRHWMAWRAELLAKLAERGIEVESLKGSGE